MHVRISTCAAFMHHSKVGVVDLMHESNAAMHEGSSLTAKLRSEVFDALMTTKGLPSLAAQARELGVDRSTLFRVRDGRVAPSASLAMKMAKLAGTSVEALFELRQGGEDRG